MIDTDNGDIANKLNELVVQHINMRERYRAAGEYVANLQLGEYVANLQLIEVLNLLAIDHQRLAEELLKVADNYGGLPLPGTQMQGELTDRDAEGRGTDDGSIIEKLKQLETRTLALYQSARARFSGQVELQKLMQECVNRTEYRQQKLAGLVVA